MQQVSRAWIQNQQLEFRSESFLEINLETADPDALEDARARDNGSMPFANTPQIVDRFDKNYLRYSMLEHNQWTLDGTFKLIPEVVTGDMGFISDALCDEYGVFETPPVVTVYFSRVHTELLPGITVYWSEALDEFAKDFNVVAYRNDRRIARLNVLDNKVARSEVFFDIQNYDRIDIEILKWCLPHRRARIEEVLVGIRTTYTKADIFRFEQNQFCDPLSASLPHYHIRFELSNINNDFDPNNPDNRSIYLMERQRVRVRYGYLLNDSIEWIIGGTYYLSGWRLPQNGLSATFEARDILEFSRRSYEKGLYYPDGISLYDLAEELLIEANMPLRPDGTVNWFLSEKLRDIYTTAPLPIKPIANCLQLIANAAACPMWFDRDGMLHIDDPPISSFIGHMRASDNGAAEFSKTSQIVDGQAKDYAVYATLEQNQWSLDNTRTMLVDGDNTGFVSDELSDEDGRFRTNPIITLRFDRLHTRLFPVISITWSTAFDEFASEFRITGYGRGRVVAQEHVTGNTDVTSHTDINLRNYDTVTIEVVRWCLPKRRARIEEIPSGLVYSITNFNSLRRAELELTKPIAGAEVKAFNYFPTPDEVELFDGVFNITGTQTEIIRYKHPAVDVHATVTGGVLVDAVYYTHSCELEISGSGEVRVVIVGKGLSNSESLVTLRNPDVRDGEWQPVNNMLITSPERAQAVAEWVVEYLSSRIIVMPNWRADPRLDVLDVAAVQNRFGFRPIRMTDIKYLYTGGFKATGTGRGYVERLSETDYDEDN